MLNKPPNLTRENNALLNFKYENRYRFGHFYDNDSYPIRAIEYNSFKMDKNKRTKENFDHAQL